MRGYRTPNDKEAARLEESRQMMRKGIEGEGDFLSRISPTMRKSAKDDIRAAKTMRERVPEAAREGEAYNQAGYKCGGNVKRYAEGGVTEGENANIDDDVRMRARAAVMRRLAGEEDESPAPSVKRSAPKAVSKPKDEPMPGPSGRPRDNVAPSGRGAASGSFRSEAPAQSKRYPTAAERGVEIRKSIADAEEENVRKRNEKAASGKSSLSDFMTGFKRRFGTQAMREEAGMKSGGNVKAYAKGGSVRGDGCAQRGKTKGRFI